MISHLPLQSPYKGEVFFLKGLFNSVFSRDILSYQLKNREYIVSLDDSLSFGRDWVVFYFLADTGIYFSSIGVEHLVTNLERFF